MAYHHVEEESWNTPLLLIGKENYDFWKRRMKVHLNKDDAIEWRVVKKGQFTFLDKVGKAKDIDDLTEAELIKANYNGKAMYKVICGLSNSDLDKVSSCITAKEIWDTLKMLYKDTTKLKDICFDSEKPTTLELEKK